MTAVNDWAPPADGPGSPYSSFHGSWDTSQPWAAQPRPGRSGTRRAVIGVVTAVTALLVIAAGVIGFVLFVAGPAGAAGGCGGG